ncbi:MAG: hypothetical protein SH868_08750 [Bythopirellula sp.]|nr:hypothetical protein [Bythopirellula sp.]
MKSLIQCFALLAWLCSTSFVAAQVVSADDHEGIFRPHPDLENVELVRVTAEEIKPGLVYNYYNTQLNQRAWGFAKEGGGFEYAFGEGTIMPTNKFDLQLSREMQARVLNERAPGLLRQLNNVGRSAAVQLNGKGVWELLQFPSSARVFDLTTGLRWEWHGDRRLAVLHTGGNLWHIVTGEYYPVTIATTLSCR